MKWKRKGIYVALCRESKTYFHHNKHGEVEKELRKRAFIAKSMRIYFPLRVLGLKCTYNQTGYVNYKSSVYPL